MRPDPLRDRSIQHTMQKHDGPVAGVGLAVGAQLAGLWVEVVT